MAELPVIQADSSLSLCHNRFDAFDGIYVVSQVRLAVASSTAVRIRFPRPMPWASLSASCGIGWRPRDVRTRPVGIADDDHDLVIERACTICPDVAGYSAPSSSHTALCSRAKSVWTMLRPGHQFWLKPVSGVPLTPVGR